MDIANLIIRVTNDGLTAAQRELRRVRDEMGRTSDANKKLRDGFDDMAKWSAIGLGVLTGGIVLATKKAMSFETAMAEVNKTVDFAASDGLANMRKGISDLTKTIPLAFEELASLAAVGGQLGVAEKDLLGFTETVAKMGIAFDITAAEAGDSMAKIAGAFKIPIADIDQLGDSINTVSNSMAATAPDIIGFLSRVGGTSAALKIAADDATALGGAMVALGLQPEVAATAFNSLAVTLARFDNLNKTQVSGFKQLGLDTAEFSQLAKTDGVGAIMAVLEATNKLSSTDGLAALANAFGTEAAVKISTMASGIDTVKDSLDLVGVSADGVSKTTGSMEAEFVKMAATSENAMQLTKNMLDAATASIGEAFLPVLNDLLVSLAPVIDKVTEWATANPELIRQIALVTASVLASIIGIKLFADGIAAAITTVENLKTAFNLAKTALSVLSGGFALPLIAIAALIAAGVLLYQNWDLVKEKASELNEWIKSKFGSLPEPLQQAGRDIAEVFMFIWNTGKEYLTLMSELYSGTFESFKTIATGAFQIVWSIIKVSFSGIVNTISTALQLVATLFSSGFALIKNTVSTVLDVIKAVISGDFKAIPSIIGNGLKAAAGIVGSMMTNILNIIKVAGTKLYSIGKDFIQGFINGIKSVGSGVASAASSMVGNAIAAVKKRQDSASPSKVTTKLGGDFSQGMANGIKKGAKAVKSEAQKMAEQAIETVKTSVASLQKEIALFGNDSPLASFNYDVGVGKFAGVPDSLLDKNRELITQKMRLIELDKQQAESVKLLAKARESIQERFAKLKTDQEASGKAVDGVMGELQAETAIGKIQADYERRIEVIRKHEELTTGLIGSEEAKRLAIYESAQKAKELIQIQGNEKLFGELSSITSKFFGEQSAAHKAMFLVEKFFALKRILVENKVALAKAWASASFPYNLPAVATVAAQTGLLAAAVKGFKTGGYTGNMGASQVAGVVHGQEYVFDAQSTKRIGVDNLNAMRRGDKVGGGGDVNITVNNMSSAKVETQKDDNGNIVMTIRDEIKRSWTNTGNPNSFESKQLNRNIHAPRRR